jgi:hypothetical protein
LDAHVDDDPPPPNQEPPGEERSLPLPPPLTTTAGQRLRRAAAPPSQTIPSKNTIGLIKGDDAPLPHEQLRPLEQPHGEEEAYLVPDLAEQIAHPAPNNWRHAKIHKGKPKN